MLERLQKIISRAGIASRRHAEQLIISGQVLVNGVVVTELGAKADPERDRVEAAGKVAEFPTSSASYILYKPSQIVSTMSDPEGRGTIRHLLRGLSSAVVPAGRLPYDASGLIFLTNDGALADRMLKASASIPKVYWVKVKGRLTDDALYDLRHRANVKMRRLSGPSAARHSDNENPWYEVELSDARHEVLRDALFATGHPVEKLKRVRLGPLDLGDLPEGHFRQLDPSEVAQLGKAIDRAQAAPKPIDIGTRKLPKPHRFYGERKTFAAAGGPERPADREPRFGSDREKPREQHGKPDRPQYGKQGSNDRRPSFRPDRKSSFRPDRGSDRRPAGRPDHRPDRGAGRGPERGGKPGPPNRSWGNRSGKPPGENRKWGDRGRDSRGPVRHGPAGHGPANRGKTGGRPGDRGPGNRGPSSGGGRGSWGQGNRGQSSGGPGNRGQSNRGPSSGGRSNWSQGNRGPSSGPGNRGPGNRGPSRGPSNRGKGGPSTGSRGPGSRGPGNGSKTGARPDGGGNKGWKR